VKFDLKYPLQRIARFAGKRFMIALYFAIAALGQAQAQAWPSKPVRIIVPFGAGTSDLVARVLGKVVGEATGQPFVIENKIGAGGAIGSAEVARSAPDGHTLLLATASTHAVAPALAKLPYDTVADFTPIAHLGDTELVILQSPAMEAKTVAEVIEFAKKNPGSVNFASNGVGTIGHLAFELFSAQAGITLNHIPYKGSGLAIPDLSADRVQLSTDVPATGIPHINAGRVRGLAVTGLQRSTLLPSVPTVAETIPGFEAITWFGLYGPKGMNPELAQRIHDAFAKAMQSPEIVERYKQMGVSQGLGSPAEFAAKAARDAALWAKVVKERNIKVD